MFLLSQMHTRTAVGVHGIPGGSYGCEISKKSLKGVGKT
jgi:hypothetical protein